MNGLDEPRIVTNDVDGFETPYDALVAVHDRADHFGGRAAAQRDLDIASGS
jgi:hypothetical protein